jgi:phage baseplate assembly protein W
MQETALTLPFAIDPYGRVMTTTDQKKIWSDRVRTVIGTTLRERLMLPEFGSLVANAFLETEDMASATITSEVERAFSSQLDALTLNSVDITFDELTGASSVNILYSLPNNEQIDTTVSYLYINGTKPAIEENL